MTSRGIGWYACSVGCSYNRTHPGRGTLIFKQNKRRGPRKRLPAFPHLTTTLDLTISNVGTRVNLFYHEKSSQLDTVTNECVSAYLEYVCDYANRWQSALSQVDHHSAGADPMFFYLKSSFLRALRSQNTAWMTAQVYNRLTIEQFWPLRHFVYNNSNSFAKCTCTYQATWQFVLSHLGQRHLIVFAVLAWGVNLIPSGYAGKASSSKA